MTESKDIDHKIRLILLNKWKSKSTPNDTSKIINERLGDDSITVPQVQYWFKRFDKGDTSIFDKNPKLNIKIENNLNDPLNALFLVSDEDYLGLKMINCNERFLTCFYRCGDYFESYNARYDRYDYPFKLTGTSIYIHDLMLNKKRILSLSFHVDRSITLNDYQLMYDSEKRAIHLTKIDYDKMTIKELDSVENIKYFSIFSAQPNENKFLLHAVEFMKGSVENEKIVLQKIQNVPDSYYCMRLMNNKLQYFAYNNSIMMELKFYEIDLEKGIEGKSETNVPIELNDKFVGFPIQFYCWAESRFYGMFETSDDQYCILTLSLETLKWTDVQIMASNPIEMLIDSNDVLTLQVGKEEDDYHREYDEPHAFYRFNLRKPQKLENLTHMFILRQSTLLGNHEYLEWY